MVKVDRLTLVDKDGEIVEVVTSTGNKNYNILEIWCTAFHRIAYLPLTESIKGKIITTYLDTGETTQSFYTLALPKESP